MTEMDLFCIWSITLYNQILLDAPKWKMSTLQTNKQKSYNTRGNVQELNPSDILNTIFQTSTKKLRTEMLESF